MSLEVQHFDGDPTEWNAFVDGHPQGTFFHRYEWMQLIRGVYGGVPYYLTAHKEDRLTGVLPLMLRRMIGCGPVMLSVPFADVGGICAADGESALGLLGAAEQLGRECRASYLELRQTAPPPRELPCDRSRVAFEVPLPGNPDQIWRALPRTSVRQPVKRAERRGLEVRVEQGDEAVAKCYDVYCEGMRDLGSPMHSASFFRELAHLAGADAYSVLVYLQGEPIGGSFAWVWGERLLLASAISLRRHFRLNPNDLLYWRLITHGIECGCSVLDLGRSPRASGNYSFKKRWASEERQLHYSYLALRRQPSLSERRERPSYRTFAAFWRHVPVPLARRIGPKLFARIPV